jgi:hypothetical protein
MHAAKLEFARISPTPFLNVAYIRIIHTSNLMKNPIQHWLGGAEGGVIIYNKAI